MYLKDGNMKIMINDNADKFIEKYFQSSPSRYQICLDNNERLQLYLLPCSLIVLQCGGS